MRMHDQFCAARQHQAGQQHLANAARTAGEVDVNHVRPLAQLRHGFHDRLAERYQLAPLRSLHHRGHRDRFDVARQRGQQRGFDRGDATANLQVRAEHQDAQQRTSD
jgi:hypothetical protein